MATCELKFPAKAHRRASSAERRKSDELFKDKQEVRRRHGYLPQEFGVYAGVSAEKMLDYLAQLKGVGDAQTRKRHVAELLQLINITNEH